MDQGNGSKLARLIYRMLRYGLHFVDKGAEYYQWRHREREINFLKRRAANLGFQLLPADGKSFWREGFTPSRCAETVSKPVRFEPLELCLSEKQMPQVVVFARSGRNQCEALEPACCAPKAGALPGCATPRLFASLILNHFRQWNHGALPPFGANPTKTVSKLCQNPIS